MRKSSDEESMREHEFFDESAEEGAMRGREVEEMRDLYNREREGLQLRRVAPRNHPREAHSQEERSSSPFVPDSSNRDDSYTPNKYDQEALRMLSGLLRSNEATLRESEQRGAKIRELSELTGLPVEFVKRRVSDFIRRGRPRAPSSD